MNGVMHLLPTGVKHVHCRVAVVSNIGGFRDAMKDYLVLWGTLPFAHGDSVPDFISC